jgi:hypothetical protein
MLTLGQPDVVQICVTNCTNILAQDVVLQYRGHVQKAGQIDLGTLGPRGEKMAEIHVVPTESGSATLWVTVHYSNPRRRPERPVPLEVRLKVAQPPEIHHHYHGPHIGKDGVIIMRGEGAGEGRNVRLQSGEDAVEISRAGRRYCPGCGKPLDAGHSFCSHCGVRASSRREGEDRVTP